MTDRLITVRELADWLQLSPQTIRNGGAGTSRIPKVRLGREVRYRREDVERWIVSRRIEPKRLMKLA